MRVYSSLVLVVAFSWTLKVVRLDLNIRGSIEYFGNLQKLTEIDQPFVKFIVIAVGKQFLK